MSDKQTCGECFKPFNWEPVRLRNPDKSWFDAPTLRRCANTSQGKECWALDGGTRTERLAFIERVYDYKYFGDYELSPEQLSAVWAAYALAANPA
jgi:hypothetical protein